MEKYVYGENKTHVAIRNLYPESVTVSNFTPFDDIGNEIVVDQELLDAEIVRLQAEYDAQEYSRNRKADYPNMGEQFNKIYDDGLTKWKSEMVDPVKTKWPKDNSGPVE